MHIKLDDLTDSRIHNLLLEHMADMTATSPPESVHALDLSGLRQPNISFWSAWDNNELLGCGALKQLNTKEGEIKSMRTVRAHLRKGVAKKILDHIIQEARQRNYQKLFLETGSMAFFEPARQLYIKTGFKYCDPFEGYVEDPNSVFMTLTL